MALPMNFPRPFRRQWLSLHKKPGERRTVLALNYFARKSCLIVGLYSWEKNAR